MPPLRLPEVWMSAKAGRHPSTKRKCELKNDHPNDGAGAMDHSNFQLSVREDLHADLLFPDWSRVRAAKWGHPNMMICARLQQETETEFVSARKSHLNFDPTLKLSGCPLPFAPHPQAILALSWFHLFQLSSACGHECYQAMERAKDFGMEFAPMDEQNVQVLTANGGVARGQSRPTNPSEH